MRASDIQIEWDEDGCYIIIDGDSVDPDYQAGCYRWRVEDPEQLYDRVKGAIGPWLRERDEARETYTLRNEHGMPLRTFACDPDESGGVAGFVENREEGWVSYDISDPKHPDFHSVHADIWDAREGK